MTYYTKTDLTRNTLAKAEDLNTAHASISAAFDKLPNEHAGAPTIKGFSEVFKIVNATGRDHSLAVGQLQDQGTIYAADSGSANALAVTLAPAPTAYAAGMRVVTKAAATNTGATTINVNSLGTKAITKSGTTALTGGEITIGMLVDLIYDGTQFQMTGAFTTLTATLLDEDDMASNSATNPASQQSIKYYIDNDVKTVAQGGTGVSTLAAGGLLVGNAANAVQVVAAGTATQILVGGGAGTAPVWGTDIPTAVTIGSAYIYRVGGTDVPVADGGTGVSTLAAGGLLVGNAANAVQVVAAGTATQILVGGGAGTAPVWTTVTGTGAPVRATNPTLVGPALGTPSACVLTNCTGLPVATGIVAGTADFKLFTNAAGTAPEWASGYKIGTFTRDVSTASGDQVIDAVGFKPSDLEFFACISDTLTFSIGFDDGTNHYSIRYKGAAANAFTYDSTNSLWLQIDGTHYCTGIIKTLDADGFTITWTKTNSPTGTATIYYRAKR